MRPVGFRRGPGVVWVEVGGGEEGAAAGLEPEGC